MDEDALAFVEEAIAAISLEVWRGRDIDEMVKVSGPDCTIAIELDRLDGALGPRGSSMFAPMAESIRQCAIALYAARQALKGQSDGS